MIIFLSIMCGALFIGLITSVIFNFFFYVSARNAIGAYDQINEAYNEAVEVLGGDLFEKLEQMRKAEVPLFQDGEVSMLYRNILATHESIYNIMSRHNLINSGEPLPPYIEEARSRIEKKYIHAQINKQSNEGDSKFRNLSSMARQVGNVSSM